MLPAWVVVVADAGDVAQTIKFAREYAMSFAVRNGRHSFAGFSANTGLIIDVSQLRAVRIDRSRERATFGAGQTNLPLYTSLWPERTTVPAGTCPTVGLTGLSCAAGFGRLSRLYGLTCDNVVDITIVTASGDVITANDRENTDLFWACRGGGGGNFGAIVALTARLHPVDMPFTEIAYTFPLQDAVRVMSAFQDWVTTLPDRGHCWTDHTGKPADGASLEIEFTYAGPEKPARALGDALISAAGVKPAATSMMTAPFLTTMRDSLCAGLRPDECAYEGLSPHGTLPRPAFYAKCGVADANVAWTQTMYDSVKPWLSGSAYQGYADPNLKDWQRQYYGIRITFSATRNQSNQARPKLATVNERTKIAERVKHRCDARPVKNCDLRNKHLPCP